jgi:hypothetical protein
MPRLWQSRTTASVAVGAVVRKTASTGSPGIEARSGYCRASCVGGELGVHPVHVEARILVYSATISTSADVRELNAKLRGEIGFLPDGRFIAMMEGVDERQPNGINVVVNWFDELRASLDSVR